MGKKCSKPPTGSNFRRWSGKKYLEAIRQELRTKIQMEDVLHQQFAIKNLRYSTKKAHFLPDFQNIQNLSFSSGPCLSVPQVLPYPFPPAVHSPAVLGVVGLRTGADHHPPALDEGIFQQIAPQQWLLGGSSLFLANKNYIKLAIRRFLPMILGYQPANTFGCYMLPSGKLTLLLKIDHL